MVPAGERAAFEMIESQLSLEIFIHALGPPAFFAETHDLLFAHSAAERGEQELARCDVAIEPFGDQPERLVFRERRAVILGNLDASEAEAPLSLELLPSRQVSLRTALGPSRSTN